MDVKELCRSTLFYPKIWENYSFFSAIDTPVVIAYDQEIDDLYYDDPTMIFNSVLSDKYKQIHDQNNLSEEQRKL